MSITYTFKTDQLTKDNIQQLFQSVEWESASHPNDLHNAILNSHSVATAWDNGRLIGLANAMSDGSMTVYFHYVLTDPDYQGQGVGKEIMKMMLEKYETMHTKVLVSYPKAVGFYESLGFEPEESSTPMYVFSN
ncbi:GNAT family N-acetyltransferase [Sporosarcina gallistercoris]|uniref:GNAT family N-acetyltransferase n=1 Tax=Sporosarcina gallistercoris TaxID=2762245 RepID=A0ABR8PHP9_9BACL|nr:GNAT family N-acetyltransferase [Sporosarcina gallistercoris]MBD7907701.1 GNAT family N-acetyltransferase [Sporosarcina gallistercoris]